MPDQKYLRIIEKGGKAVVVDVNHKPIAPADAQKLGEAVVRTAQAKAYVYVGHRKSDGLYKIGRSEHVPDRGARLKVEIVHTIPCDLYGEYAASVVEAAMHRFFEDERVEGEWFALIPIDLSLIYSYCITAAETLKFLKQFEADLWAVSPMIEEKGYTSIVVDLLDGQLTREQFLAMWYYLHKAQDGAQKESDSWREGYAASLIAIVNRYRVQQGGFDFKT